MESLRDLTVEQWEKITIRGSRDTQQVETEKPLRKQDYERDEENNKEFVMTTIASICTKQ